VKGSDPNLWIGVETRKPLSRADLETIKEDADLVIQCGAGDSHAGPDEKDQVRNWDK
jgi:hypothetical protein